MEKATPPAVDKVGASKSQAASEDKGKPGKKGKHDKGMATPASNSGVSTERFSADKLAAVEKSDAGKSRGKSNAKGKVTSSAIKGKENTGLTTPAPASNSSKGPGRLSKKVLAETPQPVLNEDVSRDENEDEDDSEHEAAEEDSSDADLDEDVLKRASGRVSVSF